MLKKLTRQGDAGNPDRQEECPKCGHRIGLNRFYIDDPGMLVHRTCALKFYQAQNVQRERPAFEGPGRKQRNFINRAFDSEIEEGWLGSCWRGGFDLLIACRIAGLGVKHADHIHTWLAMNQDPGMGCPSIPADVMRYFD